MKKQIVLLLVFCLLTGCTMQEGPTATLYFLSKNGNDFKTETRSVPEGEDALRAAVTALLEGPKTAGCARVLPEGTTLLDIRRTGTVAEINLSAPFDSGTDAERLLARYALIYTACTAPGVQKVKLLADGKPVRSLTNGEVLGAMGTADIMPAVSADGVQELFTLYFPDAAGMFLMPESRQITRSDGQTMAESVLEALLHGPSASHLIPALPPDVQVKSAKVEGGICFVNLSETFLAAGEAADGGKLAIYAIVNTLSALPDIQSVRFLIEGKTVKTIGSLKADISFTENKTMYPPQ